MQGIIGDGDLDWQALLPHLTDRFTCHLPSYRDRGLSGDHPDLSFGRLVDVHQIPGAGHASSLTNPETLAEALTEFAPAQKPA